MKTLQIQNLSVTHKKDLRPINIKKKFPDVYAAMAALRPVGE